MRRRNPHFVRDSLVVFSLVLAGMMLILLLYAYWLLPAVGETVIPDRLWGMELGLGALAALFLYGAWRCRENDP